MVENERVGTVNALALWIYVTKCGYQARLGALRRMHGIRTCTNAVTVVQVPNVASLSTTPKLLRVDIALHDRGNARAMIGCHCVPRELRVDRRK